MALVTYNGAQHAVWQPPLAGVKHFVATKGDYGPSDITILSSDKVVYHLHRDHLGRRSAVFGDASDFSQVSGVCALAEPADVLDVLFKFLYGQGVVGDITAVPPTTAFAVLEAACKYQMDGGLLSGLALGLAKLFELGDSIGEPLLCLARARQLINSHGHLIRSLRNPGQNVYGRAGNFGLATALTEKFHKNIA